MHLDMQLTFLMYAILAFVTEVLSITCSFCDIVLLTFKAAAFLSFLSIILSSVSFSLKLQWTHQSEFPSIS